MAAKSKIEWTESTWNPVTGCTKISDGCANCYACALAKRLQCMGNGKYANGFEVTLHPDVLEEPLSWQKPRIVFVNSMSDLFHEKVPTEYIQRVFSVMNRARRHTFQILTKRPERLVSLAPMLEWTSNIWQGVTVESRKYTGRIKLLQEVPACVRFVSFEPLLDDLGSMDLRGIAWGIVGGESGWSARPMHEEWALRVKQQCDEQGVLFYFKQWGGKNKKKAGRMLLGRTWDAMPAVNEA